MSLGSHGAVAAGPRLMLVTDRRRSVRPLRDAVAAAVANGVDAVQVREPDLARSAVAALLEELRPIVAGRSALLVNGDVALAADLGIGLHLPQRGLAVAAARRLLGEAALIGRSVHSPAEGARSDGADYVVAGHVYATPSHPGQTPLGVRGLAAVARAAACPTLGIGGVHADNAAAVIAAGASGVAVIGAILGADDPGAAAVRLRARIEAALEVGMAIAGAAVEATIALEVNGKQVDLRDGASLSEFLASRGLTDAMAIVERNGTIVPRTDYGATVLAEGDRLEVVHAVGGG